MSPKPRATKMFSVARPLRLGEGTIRPSPSRYDNPFATCWTKPGAIPFHFAAGHGVPQLLGLLAAANWRGAIVGPHGCGKSTLLETLKPHLIAAGHELTIVALRDGQRDLPRDTVKCSQTRSVARAERAWWPTHRPTPTLFAKRQGVLPVGVRQSASPPIVVVDGYEQLSWLARIKLIRHCRRHSLGLLVTSHRRTCLPTLSELAPTLALVEQLVAQLCDQVSTHIDLNFVAASHACHGGNVREIFFDLYDRYERIRRHTRTSTGVLS